jgi:hypothetical protein
MRVVDFFACDAVMCVDVPIVPQAMKETISRIGKTLRAMLQGRSIGSVRLTGGWGREDASPALYSGASASASSGSRGVSSMGSRVETSAEETVSWRNRSS